MQLNWVTQLRFRRVAYLQGISLRVLRQERAGLQSKRPQRICAHELEFELDLRMLPKWQPLSLLSHSPELIFPLAEVTIR